MNVKTFIKRTEDQQFPFLIGFLSLFAIILGRNILESAFEGSQMLGFTPLTSHSFYMIFVHFSLFYVSIFLWILFVFMLLTKEHWTKIAKVLLIGMTAILITPIIDIIVSKGIGYKLTYLTGFEQFTELHKFFDFTRDLLETSWGQRIEILLVLIGGSSYVFIKTKNYVKPIIAAVIIYFIIFLHGVLPNTIAKIPSYLGSHTLSFTTIITNGILPIDSQNYAVIFSLSIIVVGLLIFKKNNKELLEKIFDFKSSIFTILFLLLGIIYAILVIIPYYPFIFHSPLSYLIFLLAISTLGFANAAALSNTTSPGFHILVIASIFFAIVLGPIFLFLIVIFFLLKKLPRVKWFSLIPCFLAGFSLVHQEYTFKTIVPIEQKALEIKGRKLAGWSYFLNADYEQSLDQYLKAYSLEEDNEVLKRIGQCYLKLGNMNEGIELLSKITEPDYETILSLGQAYMQKQEDNKAIETYRIAIEENIEPADFYLKIAHIAARKGRESEMTEATDKALLYGSHQCEVYEIKGDFYLSKGDQIKALAMYNKALHYNPRSVIALSGRGITYYREGNISKAEEQFMKALKIEPNNDALYNNLGALYLVTNKLEEAERLFKKSLKKNPNQHEAYYNLGLIYEKMGKMEDALIMYHKTLGLNPSYMPAQKKIEEIVK